MKDLLHLVLMLFFLSINAQEPTSIHFSEKEGLPDRTAFNILEDNNGVFWLGANSGLYSFDGSDFTKYKHQTQDDSSVFGLQFDDEGRLWYTTITSKFYYVEDGKVVFFADFSSVLGAKYSMFKIEKGHLIISGNHSPIIVNIETKAHKPYLKRDDRFWYSMPFHYSGKDYIVSNNGMIHTINPDKSLTAQSKIELIRNATNMAFFEFGKKLFLKTQIRNLNAFYGLNNNQFEKELKFDALSNLTISFSKKLKGFYWFYTSNGAYQYQFKNGIISLKEHFLEGINTTDGIIDQNGNYIFSTLDNGLFVITNPDVLVYTSPDTRRNVITDLVVINDSIVNYINNDKLVSLNFNSKKNVALKIDRLVNQHLYYDQPNQQTFFFNNYILEFKNPLTLANLKPKRRFRFPKRISALNDSVYITTNYDRVIFYDKDLEITSEIKGRSLQLETTAFGDYYVNTAKGFKWSHTPDSLQPILMAEKPIYIKALANQKGTNLVWASRLNWGLYQFKKGKVKHSIYKLDGLLDDNVMALVSSKTNLWLSSNKGIQRYNYNTKSFTNYKFNATFKPSNIVSLQLSNNYVWFKTNTEIFRFPKDKKEVQAKIPEIYFKEIKVNDSLLVLKNKYQLDYKTSALNINFKLNGFKVLENFQFEYRVNGLTKEWVKLPLGTHQVNFPSLPSGNYTFNVRAKNTTSNSYTKTIALQLNVTKPYWQTLWFYVLLSAVVLFLTILYYKNRIKKNEIKQLKNIEKLSIENELTRLQLENLRSQMNPHFVFNALNSIQDYIVSNEKKLAVKYLVRFSRLIRLYLDHSRKELITLAQEIEALELYLFLEKDRFEDKLEYHISKSSDLNEAELLVPSLFIQPYVENAIKHGLMHKKGAQNLRVSFVKSSKNNTLDCEVLDNGIGREASYILNANSEFQSFATKANDDRVGLMNKQKETKIQVKIIDLKSDKGVPKGTKVCIQIPLKTKL